MIVTLSLQRMMEAIDVGVARQKYIVEHGKKTYWGRDYGGAKAFKEIHGAIGECAVAQLLDYPWPNRSIEDDFINRALDVGNVVNVRTRPIPGSRGELGIKPDDKADVPFVLTHFKLVDCVVDVIGWVYAREGPKDGVWSETSGCWYLPPPYRSVESLIEQFSAKVFA